MNIFNKIEFLELELDSLTRQELNWLRELEYDDFGHWVYIEKSEIKEAIKDFSLEMDDDIEIKNQVNFYKNILKEMRDSQDIILINGKY